MTIQDGNGTASNDESTIQTQKHAHTLMNIESCYSRFGGAFEKVVQLFDQHNSADPNQENDGTNLMPRELLYARRLTAWVFKLDSNPTEIVLLASRCQHIGRWAMPRNSYPMTKPGYLAWRTALKKYHADLAEKYLMSAGYEPSVIQKIRDLLLKTNLRQDPEMQIIEDALCLVFLEFQLAELSRRTDENKMVNALQKSWAKMSSAARKHALALPFSEPNMALVKKALSQDLPGARETDGMTAQNISSNHAIRSIKPH